MQHPFAGLLPAPLADLSEHKELESVVGGLNKSAPGPTTLAFPEEGGKVTISTRALGAE